ncbi:MAG: hypothetical protein SPL15_07735, partial [Lachnospiraceae bacterium]|nr:hypothetical protein [Lachnospiraceae bacterium]
FHLSMFFSVLSYSLENLFRSALCRALLEFSGMVYYFIIKVHNQSRSQSVIYTLSLASLIVNAFFQATEKEGFEPSRRY